VLYGVRSTARRLFPVPKIDIDAAPTRFHDAGYVHRDGTPYPKQDRRT